MESHDNLTKEPTLGDQPSEGEAHPMDALLDQEAYSVEMPRRGEIRSGTIARISETDLLVDIGAKSEGVIPGDEVQRLSEERRQELKVGEEVSVYVMRSGGRDGMIVLSLAKAEEEQDWNQAEELQKSEENFEGEIAGYNKGGLIVKFGNLRGFVPASQVSLSRRRRAQGSTPDQRWGKMVAEPLVAKVIEVDRKRNRLILSERAAARESREALKERLIEELRPGEIRTGQVISIADFGAFVDIGGADGLIHTSELSWKRVKHPSEVLEVGQTVQVKVLDLDPARKRISLSLRELDEDPWQAIAARFKEGDLVQGTVTKLTKFGAFARLEQTDDYEVEGLIHISELAERRIEHPSEVVEEGERLTLRVIKVEPERRRIGLSLRRVDSAEYAEADWKRAMEEMDEPAEPEVEVVEDFDAALEAEPGDVEPAASEGEADMAADELAEADMAAEPAGEDGAEGRAEDAEGGGPETTEA